MKKNSLLVLSTIVLTIVYASLCLFAYANDEDIDTSDALPLNGVWRVVTYSSGDNIALIPCEFMVFTDDTVADYRDNIKSPFIEASYTYQDGTLAIDSIGKSYVVKRAAEHVMRLYISPNEYMELTYYDALENFNIDFKHEDLQGTWNIAYRRGLEKIGQEQLVFNGTEMFDYRNGSSEPTLATSFEWDNNSNLVVSRLAKVYTLQATSFDEIYFIENDTGYVWNLTRVK